LPLGIYGFFFLVLQFLYLKCFWVEYMCKTCIFFISSKKINQSICECYNQSTLHYLWMLQRRVVEENHDR
jgi:hypothetical protein